jgi:iron(III) transport system substrate-binding protein
MPNRLSFAGAAFAAIAALSGPQRASAEGNLVVYCAVQEEWCRNMVTAFERQTGIKVAMTRKSSGEFYAQVQAEATNPRGDIWWGGTGDPHMQAAEEGLTIEYESPISRRCMTEQKSNGSSRNTARSASMPAPSATATIPIY